MSSDFKKRYESWLQAFSDHGIDIDLDGTGGFCPVQVDGAVFGHPFYFRARHGGWTLTIVEEGQDPVWMPGEPEPVYRGSGDDPSYGYMDMTKEVVPVLVREFLKFKDTLKDKEPS